MSRLIADSYLYRAIGAEINGACGKCKLSRSDCMGQSLSRMDVCGIIDDAPSVDAVEVVHGEWEKYLNEGLLWRCSVCGSRINAPYHYCPNCGAKMDGEVKSDG